MTIIWFLAVVVCYICGVLGYLKGEAAPVVFLTGLMIVIVDTLRSKWLLRM